MIHGRSGAEKNLLKVCPPGINKFADIKLQLDTYKADVEKEKKIFFEKLLKTRDISFKKEEIYPFVVYYDLSRIIRPGGIEFNLEEANS